jgi:predicted PhzF superfamily epimerase YddE/YHI9
LASGYIILSQNPALDRVTFRTRKAGILEVRRKGDAYAVALPAIPTEQVENADMMAAMGGKPLSMRSNPDNYNMFVYATAAEILALKPDLKALATLGNKSFTATARGDDTDIVSRVFVPGAGVDEDSVTGSAHAVIAPYWASVLGRDSFTAYQASARGGYLGCQLEGDRVWLSGQCFTVVKGMFSLR